MSTVVVPRTPAAASGAPVFAPIAIYYEHPRWFERLFAELDRRGAPYRKVKAEEHWFDPGTLGDDAAASIVFNRMSPSAYRRDRGASLLHTINYLEHLERSGKRVINGARSFRFEVSKALQLSLLRSLDLPFPRSRVIQSFDQAVAASAGLRFPVVVKPNVGGSGAGIVRFENRDQLAAAASASQLDLGLDHVALVQEFIPARGNHITRIETVGGKYLYGINVHLTGETFDLCPADICRTTGGAELDNACPVEAPKAGLRVEAYQPPAAVVEAIERIVQAAGIDVGGIEYVIDDRDGTLYYYDINSLSNFVSDGVKVIGFDPFVPLADFLVGEAALVRA